ncbi:MAG: hypothetical protein ACJAR2_000139 [Ilumatobacter sp.]|jgi:hypothetical protein
MGSRSHSLLLLVTARSARADQLEERRTDAERGIVPVTALLKVNESDAGHTGAPAASVGKSATPICVADRVSVQRLTNKVSPPLETPFTSTTRSTALDAEQQMPPLSASTIKRFNHAGATSPLLFTSDRSISGT